MGVLLSVVFVVAWFVCCPLFLSVMGVLWSVVFFVQYLFVVRCVFCCMVCLLSVVCCSLCVWLLCLLSSIYLLSVLCLLLSCLFAVRCWLSGVFVVVYLSSDVCYISIACSVNSAVCFYFSFFQSAVVILSCHVVGYMLSVM